MQIENKPSFPKKLTVINGNVKYTNEPFSKIIDVYEELGIPIE
ncbi:MAG: hypothetical protein ABI549_10795 [Flavobacterium sp.]